jgi:hypothetical protein
MRINIYIKLLAFVMAAFFVTSCLDGDEMNTPPNAKPFVMITNNAEGGPTVNSGIRYFPAQALLLNPTVDNDTMTFAVTLQGVAKYSKDINVTLSTPAEALDDYKETDGINYEMMPANAYNLLSTAGTIPAGKSYTEFQVVFHPSVINLKKNYMLPIAVASNDANLPISSNYGNIYYHSIGNPIAGLYKWEFIRYATPAGTGSPDIHTFGDATFAPANGTTVTGFHTGYYTTPNYILTFDDDGNGNLSNFKAILDPAALAADWDPNGIQVATGPTITVEANYTKFTIKYTTLTRNVTDIYTKK